jgi:hypothetical protein
MLEDVAVIHEGVVARCCGMLCTDSSILIGDAAPCSWSRSIKRTDLDNAFIGYPRLDRPIMAKRTKPVPQLMDACKAVTEKLAPVAHRASSRRSPRGTTSATNGYGKPHQPVWTISPLRSLRESEKSDMVAPNRSL